MIYTPRPYQDDNIEFGLLNQGTLSWLEVGLGKTIVAGTFRAKAGGGQTHILCTGNAINTWTDEIRDKFKPQYPHLDWSFRVIEGNATARKKGWAKKAAITIGPYRSVMGDMIKMAEKGAKFPAINVLIGDEISRAFVKADTLTASSMRALYYQVPYKMFLDGTFPVEKGPQGLFAYLQLLDRVTFSSYWRFVNTYCLVIKTHFGDKIVGVKPEKADELKELLYGKYLFKRTRKDVTGQQPMVQRQKLYVKPSEQQQAVIDQLMESLMYVDDEGRVIVAPNKMSTIIKMRQLLTCPKILDPSFDIGPGIQEILDHSKHNGIEHYTIFTAFTDGIPHLRKFLETQGMTVSVLQGGITSEEQREQLTRWRQKKGIMLCSIKYAQSFDLSKSSFCYTLGPEWGPKDAEQCEGRLTRSVEFEPINSWYIAHEGTVEEGLFDILDGKLANRQAIEMSPDELKLLLRPISSS